jgi:nitroreductase
MTMNSSLTELLSTRTSSREFLDLPVEEKILQEIFTLAQQSPSNCNVQPWQCYVVSGESKNKLQAALVNDVASGAQPQPDFEWGMNYQGVLRDRQHGAAHELYSAMEIERSDKPARQMAMLRNWTFFDAPHAVFFCMDRSLSNTGSVDLGIYAQTLSLLMAERGIATCMQGALGMYPSAVREQLQVPENLGILFGMSFGYADPNGKANKAKTVREEIAKSVEFFS